MPEEKTSYSSEIVRYSTSAVVAVMGAFLIMSMFGATRSAFGVFFKPVMNEFGWTRAETSAAFSLAWAVHGLSGIVIGRLTDRFGSGAVLLFCGLFMGAGHILMSQISQIWQLYLYYGVIIGIGCSVHIPILAYIARRFSERRSLMTGIVMAGVGAGQMVAPLVTAWLIATFTWQTSYIILGVIAMTIVVVSSFLLRKPSSSSVVEDRRKDVAPPSSAYKTRASSSYRALLTWKFWVAWLMFFCIAFSGQAFIVHIVPYITDLGIDTTVAAGVLSLLGVMMVVGRIVVGNAADRIGNDMAFLLGFIITGLAMLLLLGSPGIVGIYLFAVIFGFAWSTGILSSPLVAKIFGVRALGTIFGFSNLGYTLGCALGPYVFGRIYDVSGSYHQAFILNIGISAAGLILAAMLTGNRLIERRKMT